MAVPGLFAREAAVKLIHAVLMEKRLMIDIIASPDSPLVDLEPAERARAQSLAMTTLRNLEPVDAVLNTFLTQKTPFALLNILRVSATEMLVDGIAHHAAVDSAVTMAKRKQKTSHLKNLANAVLRKVSDQGAELFANQPPQGLPKAFKGQMKKVVNKEQIRAIEAAHQAGPVLDITCRDPSEAAKYAELLNGEVMPNGSIRRKRTGQISELDGFADGAWWVQDAAASIPAMILGDVTGKRVLDMCAAPGGKTMQLAAAGAKLTALDISPERMERVKQNLDRTKLNADCVVSDVFRFKPAELYDAILLDAPCSATGTIRRHPDLPFAKGNFDLSDLLKLQKDMLARASGWLKPDGILVFSTCSLFSAEGEQQVDTFVAQNEKFDMVPIDPAPYGLTSEMVNDAGQIRLRPDFWSKHGGMDGFFMAKMKRQHNVH